MQNQNNPTESKDEPKKTREYWKKEFVTFFSLNGYSESLETSSLFVKVFFLLCLVGFMYGNYFYVRENVEGFFAYEVVTQTQIIDQDALIFPAITICLIGIDGYNMGMPRLTPKIKDNMITWCFFGSIFVPIKCDISHFEALSIFYPPLNRQAECLKFNGGKDAAKQEREILTSTRPGLLTGLTITLNVSKNDFLVYYIGENKVRPEGEDLIGTAQATGVTNTGRAVTIGLTKTVDKKLADPYSKCSDSISSETSDMVKQIIEQNVTYRQVNCYQLCFAQYKNNSKTDDTKLIEEFDFKGNCSEICPLECKTTSYETVERQFIVTPESNPKSKLMMAPFVPDCFGVELSNCLQMNFYLVNRKYVEISQIVKTTLSDFVSNTGGVLGLFLELSFFSVYKFIVFVYTIIF